MWDDPSQPPAPHYPDDASYPAEPYPPYGNTPGGAIVVFVGMLGELVMRRR